MDSGNTFKQIIVFQAQMENHLALQNHMVNKFGLCYYKNVGRNVLKVIKQLYQEVQNRHSLL